MINKFFELDVPKDKTGYELNGEIVISLKAYTKESLYVKFLNYSRACKKLSIIRHGGVTATKNV